MAMDPRMWRFLMLSISTVPMTRRSQSWLLSMIGSDGVRPIDPAYALPVHTMQRLRASQAGGVARPPPAARALSFLEAAQVRAVDAGLAV